MTSKTHVSVSHLILATRQEDLAAVQRLCEQDPNVAGRASDGTTALQVAASVGNADILHYLLDKGAKRVINQASKGSGMTPIMLAAAGGHADIVHDLLTAGASIRGADANGWSALHHAAFKGFATVCNILLDDPTNGQGNGKTVDTHEDRFNQPNATNISGDTPLALAALRKHTDTCRVLLRHDANVSFLKSQVDKQFIEQLIGEDAAAAAPQPPPDHINGVSQSGSGTNTMQSRKSQSLTRTAQLSQSIEPLSEYDNEFEQEGVYEDMCDDGEASVDGEAWAASSVSSPGVYMLPVGARRARPMYVPTSGTSSSHPAAHSSHTIPSPGMSSGSQGPQPAKQNSGFLPPVKGVGGSSLLRASAPTTPTGQRVMSAASQTSPSNIGRGLRPSPQPHPRYSPQGLAAVRSSSRMSSACGSPRGGAPAGGWTLHAFSYKGLPEGLLLDKDTCLVYWMDPAAQKQRIQQQAEMAGDDAASDAGRARPRVKPPTPVLVGRLSPGAGGLDVPSYGRIAPFTTNDCGTIEMNKAAMRCLRDASPAAALLMHAARQYDDPGSGSSGEHGEAAPPPLAADLAPELGSLPLARGVSLAVPLCAVLGVKEVSELAHLTEKDLLMCDVDISFLPALLDLANSCGGVASTGGLPASSPRRGFSARPRTAAGWDRSSMSMRSDNLRQSIGGVPGAAEHSNGKEDSDEQGSSAAPSLPTLQQLLAQHGLMKLLPLAVERRLLTASEVHHWDELGNAAAMLPMSRAELVRLKGLMTAIKGAQDTALMMQASRMELLMRLTVGSQVLYEADPLRAALRGERLAGVVLDDLGPSVGASGKQFKVRDLLDDSISWLTPGQVWRLPASDALLHLRADLLPPTNSCGAPVTPLSAFPGLAVLMASFQYQPAATAASQDAASNGFASLVSGKQVIGMLIEPASEDGLSWRVRWPDEGVRVHNIGKYDSFELVHLQLHRLAAAPLAHSHFGRLLCGRDMLCLPVTRSPLWPRATTDDTVPGSLGLGFADAAQTALSVVWSRSRDQEASLYSPDAMGLYPLCHGLLEGSPVTALCAKEGVMVEPGAGGQLTLMGAASSGPGVLLAPLRMGLNNQSVVWKVRWASGLLTEHELGLDLEDPELVVHETLMAPADNSRIALLNEVSKRAGPHKGGAAGAAATTGAVAASNALQRSQQTLAAAATAAAGRLGRPLFCKTPALAAQAGMLGLLVKLNLGALPLQPGVEQGPMMSYEPRSLAMVLAAKKEGLEIGPAPRDDVGMVVRDLGPGTWRGLLVRKLGTTEAYWYDESVLLPSSHEDIAKQVSRRGPNYVLPRHLQGVPVTDASAAPGMLVQRAYAPGTVMEGSGKAAMVGELLRSVPGGNAWEVAWPDGSTGTYKTGARNKFQLAYVNLHERAGAPLLATTVTTLAAVGAGRIGVIEGPHTVTGGMPPGTVRFVNDPDTQQGLLQEEVTQLQAAGMVATSAGERRFAGGMLRLYELSHAIIPNEYLTIYTAKRGLRVALQERGAASATDGSDAGVSGSGEGGGNSSAGAQRPLVKLGVLLGPTRLAVRAVLDAGSGTGSGQRGGPTASREPVLLLDPGRCFWEVQWDNGRVEEVCVGTSASHTPLRVAPSQAPAKSDDGQTDEETPPQPKPVEVVENFVRMTEPLMLLPTGNAEQEDALIEMAAPLQRAIGWNNQMMRELCRVWWSAARLAAAEEEALDASEKGMGGQVASQWKRLWRPELERVLMQPDQLTLVIKARQKGRRNTRWRPLFMDPEGLVNQRIGGPLDTELAKAAAKLAQALAAPGADDESEEQLSNDYPQLHLVLTEDGALLQSDLLSDGSGRTVKAPSKVVEAAELLNDAIISCRESLRGPPEDPEMEMYNDDDDDDDTPPKLQFEIAFAIEPSMGGARAGSKHGSVMVTMVKELPPALQRAHVEEVPPPAAEDDDDEEGVTDGQREGSGEQDQTAVSATSAEYPDQEVSVEEQEAEGDVTPVGPAALLACGETATLHQSLLNTHRALGALGALGVMDGSMGEGEEDDSELNPSEASLQLVGERQWCMWLDLPEHPMPARLGAVRCLASVNVQLFKLRRLCARLNKAAGGGSANIADPLMSVLHLIHAKAQAGVAADAAQRRAKEAAQLASKGRSLVVEMVEEATDVKPFDDKRAAKVLTAIRNALEDLKSAEGAAADAQGFAEQAQLAPAMPVVEDIDSSGARGAKVVAERATLLSAEAQHRAFPEAVVAVHRTALSVTAIMRAKLLEAEEAYAAARAAAALAQEKRRQADAADKAMRNAEDDARAAHEAEARKVADLEKAQSNVAANEKILADSQMELKEAQQALCEVLQDNGGEQDAEQARITKTIHARVDAAEDTIKELNERLEKMRAHAGMLEADLEKAQQATKDATATLDNKRAQAVDVANAAVAALKASEEAARNARVLDPGSTKSEARGTQAQQAARTAAAVELSLQMLQELRGNMPASLRAPKAVARLLARSNSVVSLVGAAAAAEWARTSCLPLEAFMIKLEEAEAVAAREAAAAAAAAGQEKTSAGSSSSKGGTAAAGGPHGYVPPLPALKDVTTLLDCVKSDLLKSMDLYKHLLPQVDAETTLTERAVELPAAATDADDEGTAQPEQAQDLSAAALSEMAGGPQAPQPTARILTAPILAAVLERAVTCAAGALEKLATAANANVAAAVADAAAAAATITQEKQGGGPPNPAATAQAVANATVAMLPRALLAARIAAMAAAAAQLLPPPAEVPIQDAKVAQAMSASIRATATASAKAQQQVTALANDVASKLMKTHLGAAASPASVLCSAYADLAMRSHSTEEAEFWCSESATAWPKARAAAKAAIDALAPPPPPPAAPAGEAQGDEEGEGEDAGSEKDDKPKQDPAELAAKAAAVAEATRVVSSYLASIAVKMALAAVDWASKLMDPLVDLGMEEVDNKVALAAARLPPPSTADLLTSDPADDDDSACWLPPAPTSTPAPRYPDEVVALCRALALPLRMANSASRFAGSHTGLDEVDDSVKDTLAVASEAARSHIQKCLQGLEEIAAGAAEAERPVSVEEGEQALGLAYCAMAAHQAAEHLVPLVPLVLPEEKVDTALAESAVLALEAQGLAQDMYQEAQAKAPRKAVAGAASAGQGHGLTLALQVVLSRRDLGSAGDGADVRPQSPTRRRPPSNSGSTVTDLGPALGFQVEALDLDFVFAPPADAPPLSEGEQATAPSDAPASSVLDRPTVAGLLQPFRTLIQAANEAASAVAAAVEVAPSDSHIMHMVGLSVEASAAAAVSAAAQTPASRQAARTNASQLQRWGPTVANMVRSVQLVFAGFKQAEQRAREELPPLVLPYDIVIN